MVYVALQVLLCPSLSKDLVEYTYRTSGLKQQYLKPKQVYDLVIQAFFNIRKLFKKKVMTGLKLTV